MAVSAAAAFFSKSARCGILGTFLRNRASALDCSIPIAQEAGIQSRGRRRKKLGLHRNGGWLLIKERAINRCNDRRPHGCYPETAFGDISRAPTCASHIPQNSTGENC